MPTLDGNDLDNELTGGDENDTINGFGGNDRLLGKGGSDVIDGGSGADLLAGGAGSDTLNGGADRDILFGGEANLDALNQSPNPENAPPAFSLTADTAADTLNGGAGNDVFFAGYGDTVNGGGGEFNGTDTVHVSYLGAPQGMTVGFNSTPGVNINGANLGWVQGSNFSDTFSYVSNLLAMGGDDQIVLSGLGLGYVDAGDGNDTITINQLLSDIQGSFQGPVLGGAGDDVIRGQATDIDGGAGNDTIYGIGRGGTGDDIIYGRGRGDAGNDLIDATALPVYADYPAYLLTGDAGSDVLRGSAANDILSADREIGFDNFTEVDQLFGGAGDDFFYSGYGDIVDGGDGFDTVGLSYVGATHGIVGDTAILHQGIALVDGAGTFQSIERFSDLALTQFDDKMVIGDQDQPAVVRSWDGDDHLVGQLVSITMYGGNGNDLLVGSTSFDVLYGESGNDRLIGYFGADVMYGGGGADRFMYGNYDVRTQGAVVENIMDFQSGTDKIDLTDVDANASVAGDQAFTYLGSAAFSNHAGELRTYSSGGVNYLAGDVNGDGSADLLINLATAQVVQSDFLL